jgi:citrate lyase beta subunit
VQSNLETSIREMQIFQFMSIQKAPLLYRLLKKTISQDCIVILDLEDTLGNLDKKKSKSLKAWGRRELIKFVKSYPDFFKNKKIGIRINKLKSLDFEEDLKTISQISKIWDLFCIVGPKTESKKDLCEYLCFLENNKVRHETFIPIIETVKGLKNLSSIVDDERISYAFYGHNDYSLDTESWPFLEQDETEFWKIVSSFIKKVEAKKVHYIHTPLFHFANESLSIQVSNQLQKRCSILYGIVTINSSQTSLFNRIKRGALEMKKTRLTARFYSLKEKTDLALQVKKLFFQKKRNFGFDLKTKKFFSPHELFSALKFLEKNHG